MQRVTAAQQPNIWLFHNRALHGTLDDSWRAVWGTNMGFLVWACLEHVNLSIWTPLFTLTRAIQCSCKFSRLLFPELLPLILNKLPNTTHHHYLCDAKTLPGDSRGSQGGLGHTAVQPLHLWVIHYHFTGKLCPPLEEHDVRTQPSAREARLGVCMCITSCKIIQLWQHFLNLDEAKFILACCHLIVFAATVVVYQNFSHDYTLTSEQNMKAEFITFTHYYCLILYYPDTFAQMLLSCVKKYPHRGLREYYLIFYIQPSYPYPYIAQNIQFHHHQPHILVNLGQHFIILEEGAPLWLGVGVERVVVHMVVATPILAQPGWLHHHLLCWMNMFWLTYSYTSDWNHPYKLVKRPSYKWKRRFIRFLVNHKWVIYYFKITENVDWLFMEQQFLREPTG